MKISKTLLVCALMPTLLFGQTRISTPDVRISEEPVAVMEEGFTGWTYSLDGKWIKGENCIFPRLLSVQNDRLKTPPYSLGIDNMQEIQVYEVFYGADTLLLILKPFEDGYFKYTSSQTGWRKQNSIHYFVIDKPKSHLNEIQDTLLHTLEYKLYDSGTISDISLRKSIPEISKQLNLSQKSNRLLYLDFQVWKETGKIRFMLYSNHEVFHDLRGTVGDITIRGKSLFGTPQLLNYIYFEADLNVFSQLNIL